MISSAPSYMIDVDGVLCDFVFGFTTLGNKIYGTPIYHHEHQRTWDGYDGLSNNQAYHLWDVIAVSCWDFWPNLPHLLTKEEKRALQRLCSKYPVYFVTSRKSPYDVQKQTVFWLENKLGIANPNVITSSLKGEVAAGLGVWISLDDKAENAWCVHWMTHGETTSYLLERPYNTCSDCAIGSSKIMRVPTVGAFLEAAWARARSR